MSNASPWAHYMYAAQQGRCFYCNQPMDGDAWEEGRPKGWTRGLVKPVSLGGHHGQGNTVLLCRPCKTRKGQRRPSEEELKRARECQLTARDLRRAHALGGWKPSNGIAAAIQRAREALSTRAEGRQA